MKCDIKIGIGACTPHVMNGYGGGGKLFFPGIAGIRTTAPNHNRREFAFIGTREKCGMRKDIEEMTAMIGEIFKIDAILNSRNDTVALFAGDPHKEYYEAIETAYRVNSWEPLSSEKDAIVVNANVKYNECSIAVYMVEGSVKKGGDIVMVNFCEDGQCIHYAMGAFGDNVGGPVYTPMDRRPEMKAGRIILYTPYPDLYSATWYNEPDKVVFAKTWDEVIRLLSERGDNLSAAVVTDGSIGYFRR